MSDEIAEVEEFVRELVSKEQSVDERRKRTRHSYVAPVVVLPAKHAEGRYEPCGTPRQAVTRDISTNGISLIQKEPIEAGYLFVKIKKDGQAEMHVMMRVTRCRPIGPYYELAGELVARPEMGARDQAPAVEAAETETESEEEAETDTETEAKAE